MSYNEIIEAEIEEKNLITVEIVDKELINVDLNTVDLLNVIKKLDHLEDININSPLNGQVLVYEDGYWINQSELGLGDMLKSIYDTDGDGIVDKAESISDGLTVNITALEIKDVVDKSHQHSNKSLLDTYNQTNADLEDAVNKKHIQNTDTSLGIQTENLDMGTHKIVNVVDPIDNQDVATKKYVDDSISVENLWDREDSTLSTFYAGDSIKIDSDITLLGNLKDNSYSVTVADLYDAVTKKHTQNTDTKLDEGGANEIGVSEVTRKNIAETAYYIDPVNGNDSNPGTSAQPFKTIQHAIDLLPDVLDYYVDIILKDGTYNEQVLLGDINAYNSSVIGGAWLSIYSEAWNADNVLITYPGDVFIFFNAKCQIYLGYVSIRTTANNGSCVVSHANFECYLDHIKFGDNGNPGSRGVKAFEGLTFVSSASDIDSNKVGTGMTSNSTILYDTDNSVFGDITSDTFQNGMISSDITDAIAKKHLREHSLTNISDHTDINVGVLSANQLLLYNGSQWINTSISTLFNNFIKTEIPTEITSVRFQTSNNFIASTLEVYFNGIKEPQANITIISSNTFEIPLTKSASDDIEVRYVKS